MWKTRKRKKKKPEMSKLILIGADLMSAATLILTFAAVFMTGDLSPLAYLIPAVFGLSSVAHGFYFWKAKAENLQKFGQADKISAEDDLSGSGEDFGSVG